MMLLPDVTDLIVRRHANYLEQEARQLEEDALAAGAMQDEFRVVHVFRRSLPFGTELR